MNVFDLMFWVSYVITCLAYLISVGPCDTTEKCPNKRLCKTSSYDKQEVLHLTYKDDKTFCINECECVNPILKVKIQRLFMSTGIHNHSVFLRLYL